MLLHEAVIGVLKMPSDLPYLFYPWNPKHLTLFLPSKSDKESFFAGRNELNDYFGLKFFFYIRSIWFYCHSLGDCDSFKLYLSVWFQIGQTEWQSYRRDLIVRYLCNSVVDHVFEFWILNLKLGYKYQRYQYQSK